MEEKLDNNASSQNNNNVPNTNDKNAAVLLNSVESSVDTECTMDKNRNVNNVNLNLNLNSIENGQEDNDLKSTKTEPVKDDKNSKQITNGFSSETNIMNNGKLKRSDDQLSETLSDSQDSNDKIVTKKICNNNTKSQTNSKVKKENSSLSGCNAGSSGSSTNNNCSMKTKEEAANDNNSLSENTEIESNADQFDTEEDEDLTEDEEDNCGWDCSLCTYRNTPDALRCLMCDVKKNISTSTRPRINPKLLAQQVAKQQQQIQQQALKASSKEKTKAISSEQRKSIAQTKTQDLEAMSPTSSTCSTKSVKKEKQIKEENGLIDKKSKFIFKSKDVDRSSGISKSITVNNLTVMITEYPLINGKKSAANLKQK